LGFDRTYEELKHVFFSRVDHVLDYGF